MKIVYDDQIFIEQKWGGISNLFINYFKQISKNKNLRFLYHSYSYSVKD